MLVGCEIEHGLGSGVIFDDGDAVVEGEAFEQGVSGANVGGFEKVDGGTCFHQQQDLRGFRDGREVGDGLLDAVVEDVEVFATQAFDEITVSVGDDYANVDTIDADANRLCRCCDRLLCSRERGNCGEQESGAEHGVEFRFHVLQFVG